MSKIKLELVPEKSTLDCKFMVSDLGSKDDKQFIFIYDAEINAITKPTKVFSDRGMTYLTELLRNSYCSCKALKQEKERNNIISASCKFTLLKSLTEVLEYLRFILSGMQVNSQEELGAYFEATVKEFQDSYITAVGFINDDFLEADDGLDLVELDELNISSSIMDCVREDMLPAVLSNEHTRDTNL